MTVPPPISLWRASNMTGRYSPVARLSLCWHWWMWELSDPWGSLSVCVFQKYSTRVMLVHLMASRSCRQIRHEGSSTPPECQRWGSDVKGHWKRRSESYLAQRRHRDAAQKRLCHLLCDVNQQQAPAVSISISHLIVIALFTLKWKVRSHAPAKLCCMFSVLLCLCRMDDIQLCKEITRLKKDLHKLVSIPGTSRHPSLDYWPKVDGENGKEWKAETFWGEVLKTFWAKKLNEKIDAHLS